MKKDIGIFEESVVLDLDVRSKKRRQLFIKNLVANASKNIRKLEEIPDAPSGIGYFLNILKRIHVERKDVERPPDVKTIATYCVMVPEELIYACQAIPVKLCSGSHVAAAAGNEVSPRDACPVIKAILGSAHLKLIPASEKCAAYIVPTSCDCKRKMIGELARNKKVLPIHVPAVKVPDQNKDLFVVDLYQLKNSLEEITGQKISYQGLAGSIKRIAAAQQEIYKLYRLQMQKPAIIRGSLVMAVLNSYSYDIVDRWASYLRALNLELEQRLKAKKYAAKDRAPRFLIAGSPIIFPNLKMPMLIEEAGGIVAADETCAGSRWLYDPVVVTEKSMDGLMRALAARYVLPCSCPVFINNEQRIFKLQQMIEDFQIEGVIYHVLRGCLVYDFEVQEVEAELKRMNIPMLRVETDYNEEDIEQLRIRFEAFVELIKYQKKPFHRKEQLG